MKLKGYLRGLGAGIFISAVLMGITTHGKSVMTDEEIKKRAAALGMVEEDSVLVKPKLDETIPELASSDPVSDNKEDNILSSDNVSKEDTDKMKQEDNIKDRAEDKEVNEPESNTFDAKDTDAVGNDKVDDNEEADISEEDIRAKEDRAMGGQNELNTASAINTDSFTLQIASGATSYDVAKLLKKGGAIDDADKFDDYLCDNHLDNKINHGVFKIPAGAGYEEIAGIITGRK